jgi:hypothetical protein
MAVADKARRVCRRRRDSIEPRWPSCPPPAGLAVAVVMALAVPRIRLRLPVPVAGRARSLAWRLRMWTR